MQETRRHVIIVALTLAALLSLGVLIPFVSRQIQLRTTTVSRYCDDQAHFLASRPLRSIILFWDMEIHEDGIVVGTARTLFNIPVYRVSLVQPC